MHPILRFWWRRPLTYLLAVLALGVGVAVAAAVFAAVDGVLLRDFGVPGSDDLVVAVATRLEEGGHYTVPYHRAVAWREAEALESLAVHRAREAVLGTGRPVRVSVSEVSAEYFEVLGIAARAGRTFTAEEHRVGARSVVVSDRFWADHLGRDPDAITANVTLDGELYDVVGVMPPLRSEHFLGTRDLWRPLVVDEAAALAVSTGGFSVLARKDASSTLEDVRADLASISERLAVERAHDDEGWAAEVHSVAWWIRGGLERPLSILGLVGGLVFLIGSASLGNLLVAVELRRRDELAVRRALGASDSRLKSAAIHEMIPVVVGTWVVASLGVFAVGALTPTRLTDRLPGLEAGLFLSGRTMALIAVVSTLGGLAAGLLARSSLLRRAQSAPGRWQSASTSRLREGLVGLSASLATACLVLALLLGGTAWNLRGVEPGFVPEGLWTTEISMESWSGDPVEQRTRLEELFARIEALPGVQRVAGTAVRLPLTGNLGTFELYAEGHPRSARPDVVVTAQLVSPGYFETLGIPLVRGRVFADGETWEPQRSAIVNETMARRLWSGTDPIGRWVEWQSGDRATVVGVVGDVRQGAIGLEPSPELVLPWGPPRTEWQLALRIPAERDPGPTLQSLRSLLSQVFPGRPIEPLVPATSWVARSWEVQRWTSGLAGVFAGVALGLGFAGLAGVVAETTTSRRRELAVRAALGARPRDLVGSVLRQALRPVGIGAAVGLAGAVLARPLLDSLLYGVDAGDPRAYVAGAMTMLAGALLVTLGPAVRAAFDPPSPALRGE